MTSRSGANPAGAPATAVGHCTESTGADRNITPAPAAQRQKPKIINFICLRKAQPSRFAGRDCGCPRARPRLPMLPGSAAAVPARSLPAQVTACPGVRAEREFFPLVLSGLHRTAFPRPSMVRTMFLCSNMCILPSV